MKKQFNERSEPTPRIVEGSDERSNQKNDEPGFGLLSILSAKKYIVALMATTALTSALGVAVNATLNTHLASQWSFIKDPIVATQLVKTDKGDIYKVYEAEQISAHHQTFLRSLRKSHASDGEDPAFSGMVCTVSFNKTAFDSRSAISGADISAQALDYSYYAGKDVTFDTSRESQAYESSYQGNYCSEMLMQFKILKFFDSLRPEDVQTLEAASATWGKGDAHLSEDMQQLQELSGAPHVMQRAMALIDSAGGTVAGARGLSSNVIHQGMSHYVQHHAEQGNKEFKVSIFNRLLSDAMAGTEQHADRWKPEDDGSSGTSFSQLMGISFLLTFGVAMGGVGLHAASRERSSGVSNGQLEEHGHNARSRPYNPLPLYFAAHMANIPLPYNPVRSMARIFKR